ncbi:unnamed protein product [Gadus morhua 'NCC']
MDVSSLNSDTVDCARNSKPDHQTSSTTQPYYNNKLAMDAKWLSSLLLLRTSAEPQVHSQECVDESQLGLGAQGAFIKVLLPRLRLRSEGDSADRRRAAADRWQHVGKGGTRTQTLRRRLAETLQWQPVAPALGRGPSRFSLSR